MGRVAVVTGSTSGIGLGIAEGLARAGFDVMLNGLATEHEAEAPFSSITISSPPRARAISPSKSFAASSREM